MIKAMKKGFVYFLFIIIVINVVQDLNKEELENKSGKKIEYINKD